MRLRASPERLESAAMKRAMCAIVLSLLAAGLCGCEKALFTESMARSPYERYELLRGRPRNATEPNAFGGKQPALRERLRPLGAY